LLLYQLNALRPIALPDGAAHAATLEHLDLLCAWRRAFEDELGMSTHESSADVRRRVMAQTEFIWGAGAPVAIAAYRKVFRTGARIIGVYVPPAHRRRGYASAVVHAVTRHVQQLGFSDVFLFTDADNVAPNAVYTRLGFEPLGEFADYRFAVAQPSA
jgi:predicted GNAT family acetyltransferase